MDAAVISALTDAAAKDSHIVLLTDDGADDALRPFRAMLPDQWYGVEEGSADALIGLAAGLAMNDHRVFILAHAPMMTFRTCEFLRSEICRNKLPVAIITEADCGDPAAISALMQTLPGMRVIVARNPKEARAGVAVLAGGGPGVLSVTAADL